MNAQQALTRIAVLNKKMNKAIKKKKYKLYGQRTNAQINRSIQCTQLKDRNLIPYILLTFICDPYWRKLMAMQMLHEIFFYGYRPERMGTIFTQLRSGTLRVEMYLQNLCMPLRIMPLGTDFPEINIPIYTPTTKTFMMAPHVLYALCKLVDRNPFLTVRNVFPTTYLFCHLDARRRLRNQTLISLGLFLALIQGAVELMPQATAPTLPPLFKTFFQKCNVELLRMESDV